MSIQTVAGTEISISAGTPATLNATGYAALSFTAIGYVTDGGGHGRTYAVVTGNFINTRGTVKRKGTYNDGQKTLQLSIDPEDAGQELLRTALNDDADYSFKVSYPDGHVDYFQAQVTSFAKSTAGADTWVSASITLEITAAKDGTGIVEVTPTP